MNTHPDPWGVTTVIESPADALPERQLMQRLPQLLRMAGAAALLVAMYSFLVQGWQDGNDLLRYAMLLGHSLALCGLGLASGHWLRENKGARLLLTLALASVPANFAILGAFLYAQVGDGSPLPYPHYALWRLDSLSATVAILVTAGLLLIPVVLLGFRVLARSLSSRFALLYLAGNAALLIPLRDPIPIAALTLALALLALLNNGHSRDDHLAARTPDGLIARLLQYLPLAVLLGRSFWLYNNDDFLFTSALLILFLVARQLSLILPGQSTLRGLLEVGSALLTPLIGLGLFSLLHRLLPDALLLPVISLAIAGLLFELSSRVEMAPPLYRTLSMLTLLIGLLGNLALFGGLGTALLCIAAGTALAVCGHLCQQWLLTATGVSIAAAGLLYQLFRILIQFDLGSWLSLAVLGILAILLASLLETRGAGIRPWLQSLRRHYGRDRA